MSVVSKLTREKALEVVSYDPLTGIFKWLERTPEQIPDKAARHGFNTKCAGQKAGTQDRPVGSDRIMIGGRYLYARNIAYLIMTGELPRSLVAHRDGNGLNLKWANLVLKKNLHKEYKPAPAKEVRPTREGVVYYGYSDAYRAFIHIGPATIPVGEYKGLQEAVEARSARMMELGL